MSMLLLKKQYNKKRAKKLRKQRINIVLPSWPPKQQRQTVTLAACQMLCKLILKENSISNGQRLKKGMEIE